MRLCVDPVAAAVTDGNIEPVSRFDANVHPLCDADSHAGRDINASHDRNANIASNFDAGQHPDVNTDVDFNGDRHAVCDADGNIDPVRYSDRHRDCHVLADAIADPHPHFDAVNDTDLDHNPDGDAHVDADVNADTEVHHGRGLDTDANGGIDPAFSPTTSGRPSDRFSAARERDVHGCSESSRRPSLAHRHAAGQ